MSTPVQENVFEAPWRESDIILLVEETEFHVHRSILTLQSPVFKAMLNGHFKEAIQDKITLQGKTSADMLQFLKLLYPRNMIRKPLVTFTGESALKMLALADEYQAEDVLNQCLEETEITAKNALAIFPYAMKYNKSVHDDCIDIIKENISSQKITRDLSEMDNQVLKELLATKCHHLELIADGQHHFLIRMLKYAMTDILDNIGSKTTQLVEKCGHQISVRNFHGVRECRYCAQAYIQRFIKRYVFHTGKPNADFVRTLFNILEDGDDVHVALTE